MSRVKGGTINTRRRKYILRQTKGFRFGRSKKKRQAREAIFHAGKYAFAHRRDKKADMRALWTVKINAEVRKHGMSYSKFIAALGKGKVGLDRKILALLAEKHPETFAQVVKAVA